MKKIIVFITIIIMFFIVLYITGRIVSLKYINEFPEGSFISDYYFEENKHDVIFLGDCEAYTSFSPMKIYEEEGITSFVRGNSQQLIGQSYYVLKETLNYEIPKVVVLSIGGIRNTKQKEEYNRLLLDKMRLSKEKIDLIKYSMVEKENLLSYIFPLLRYHSRITDLNNDDIKYLFKDEVVSYSGFLINTKVRPLTALPSKKVLESYNFSDDNIYYLKKIVELCKNNNITLILVKAPTMFPYWYDEYDNYITSFAKENNIDYYNLINNIDEIGLDFLYDTYDGGVHLNLTGAEKLSKYFSSILKEKYYLNDNRLDEKIKIDYNKKMERYNEKKNEKDS